MAVIADILARAEPALRQHRQGRPHPADRLATFEWEIARDRLAPGLSEALLATPLFARAPRRMLNIGAGYCGFHAPELAGQLLEVTAAGGAARAVTALERLQNLEGVDLEYRHLVWGLAVEQPRELVPGVYVRQVEGDEHQARQHEWEASDWRDWSQLCAFSATYAITPAFEAPDEALPPAQDPKVSWLRSRMAELTTVLVAYGGKPLTFEMGETRHRDPELQAVLPFLGRSRGPGEMRVLRPFASTLIDEDAVAFCRAYEALCAEVRQRVAGASTRLHRGLCRPGAAEMVIDAVRALEYLFRESASKVRANRNTVMRQVRLLLPQASKHNRALLDEVYALRNAASHGEDLPGEALETARQAAAVCAEVVRTVVSRGRI